MAAMKPELINVKSRYAGVTHRYLNSRHKTGIKIAIVIANQLLALAQFDGHFASFLAITNDDPKAYKGDHKGDRSKPGLDRLPKVFHLIFNSIKNPGISYVN